MPPFLSAPFLRFRERRRIAALPRIATIATMPSRAETFQRVVERISPQVDRMFVFLDGFDAVPSNLIGREGVTIARSQECRSGLHAAGRFLVLATIETPSVVVSVDDDIDYPRDYVDRLVAALARTGGRAVVGVHGGRFRPPYRNILTDVERFHFARRLLRRTRVDELGSGTCAFLSEVLSFDVDGWRTGVANDLLLAMEAKARGLPLVCIPRRRGWLTPLDEDQADGIWTATRRDPTEKTLLMRELMAEAVARFEGADYSADD